MKMSNNLKYKKIYTYYELHGHQVEESLQRFLFLEEYLPNGKMNIHTAYKGPPTSYLNIFVKTQHFRHFRHFQHFSTFSTKIDRRVFTKNVEAVDGGGGTL